LHYRYNKNKKIVTGGRALKFITKGGLIKVTIINFISVEIGRFSRF
jgi:hypothetical protein